ncbi:hypothetical protein RB213_011685 [Colletotrichum asianum]
MDLQIYDKAYAKVQDLGVWAGIIRITLSPTYSSSPLRITTRCNRDIPHKEIPQLEDLTSTGDSLAAPTRQRLRQVGSTFI